MIDSGRFPVLVSMSLVLILACSGKPVPEPAKPAPTGAIDPMKAIEELASPAYEGRQAGSVGGTKAGAYIEGLLGAIGLPIRKITFRERAPLIAREPSMVLHRADGTEEAFVFREDFRDIVRGAWVEEEVEGPVAILDGADAPFSAGSIVVLPYEGYSHGMDEVLLGQGAKAILLRVDEETARMRSTWAGQPPMTLASPRKGLAKLAISPGAFARIGAAKGGRLSIRNPLGFADVECVDYLASYNGDGGAFEPRVLLMAHYDHLGLDGPGGAYFPGAFDNASGAALLLALAEDVVLGKEKADIAFLFTDAEEINLSGASAFMRDPPFSLGGMTVLNFDMVASSTDMVVSLYSNGDEESVALAEEVKALLSAASFEAKSEYPVPNVDTGAFRGSGAAAVTLCEYDHAVYHTRRDEPSGISAQEMSRLEDAFYAFAVSKALKP